MSNYLLGFPNKKERDDFLIALVVIVFFMWLFWYFLHGEKKTALNVIPPVAAVAVENLDMDMDGVYDIDDLCPNERGPKENKGCPLDFDRDGIYDEFDECPKLAGVLQNRGCPKDTDGDGIYDIKDKCPKIKFSSASGCPPDTDGDGIFDANDKCPNVKGTIDNDGCPFSKKEEAMMIDLSSSVEFETGRAILKPSSKIKLDQLAVILARRKATKLKIEGHTDSDGEELNNMILSKDRAAACRAYLVSKGIAESRLKAYGYGETKPRAPNTTEEGKQRNRRVMFISF